MKRFQQGCFCPLLMLALFLTVCSTAVKAQEQQATRSFGLSASLQGGQTLVLVPIWFGDKITVAPGVGLQYSENVSTNIALFLVPKLYLDMRRVAPYISGTIGLMRNDPNVGTAVNNLQVGIGFGGEYFVNAKFSFGVEAQLNALINDLSGTSTMGLNTGAAASASVYF